MCLKIPFYHREELWSEGWRNGNLLMSGQFPVADWKSRQRECIGPHLGQPTSPLGLVSVSLNCC